MHMPEPFLSKHIMARATRRGNEYAWPIEDIPMVIDAARAEGLLNVGGQLQFRIPKGGTCECYWVEVDTANEELDKLCWDERVAATAFDAVSQFHRLCDKYDFVAEGRSAFAEHLEAYEATGGDICDALCFVWYVKAPQAPAANQAA